MRIKAVKEGSLGQRLGLRAGDDLVKINGHRLRDIVDYHFFISDDLVTLTLRREGRVLEFSLQKDPDDSLGLEFEDFKYRSCNNKCIFCFVDQNPKGLRRSLYFKDEDYRLSFLYGNYITLTNLSRADMERIVFQRLSPLYVSVHTTDVELRRRLMGIERDDKLLDKIDHLTSHGIEIHAQIVLCPEINDGIGLQKTILDLAVFFPHLKSVAVVPVGLTKHRDGLYPLKPVDGEYARRLIGQIKGWQRDFKEKLGCNFVYLSDEFYLLSGEQLPPVDHYDGFPQLENGVGMTRAFMESFRRQERSFPPRLRRPKRVTLVTGILASGFIKNTVVRRLNQIENLKVDLIVVRNDLFGDTVTVSGLLPGRDILKALRSRDPGDLIVLPANCVNTDGLFLDDLKPESLEKRLRRKIILIQEDFSRIFELL